MPRWRALEAHEISTKSSPTDLVTIADQRAEAALAAALVDLMPGSLVVGEEGVAADPTGLRHLGQPGPVWVIDPIDGTGAFTRGETGFGCLLALVGGQELIAAWILQPVSGDLFMGERGAGLWHVGHDGRESRLSPRAPTDVARMAGIVSGAVAFGGSRVVRDQVRHHFGLLTHMRCPAIDYPRVLRGEIHFTTYARCLPWDHLAGQMLLGEAGWMAAKLDGTPYRVGDRVGGLMIAPSPEAWHEIRRRLLQPLVETSAATAAP